MIPVLASKGGGFLAKNGKWIILAVVILIALYFGGYKISEWWDLQQKKRGSTESKDDPNDPSGSGAGTRGGNGLQPPDGLTGGALIDWWNKNRGGGVSSDQSTGGSFRADVIAEELYNALDGIWVLPRTKEEAARRFWKLPYRNQQIAVWNYWNNNYAEKMDNETIYGAMLDEWATPSVRTNLGTKSYWTQVLELFENDPKMNYKTLRK